MLTYVSLFSSAGVGCYGFKQNGFECIATNEILEKRLKIQKFNSKCRYESGYIQGDISDMVVKHAIYKEVERWKKSHNVSCVDVVIATPPCQGMSVANHKKTNELVRNSLVIESISLTKAILPRFFIYENVRSFLSTICTDNGVDKTIGNAIDENLGGNYNILSKVVNFKDFGANSSRTRTLVIGVRKDILNVTPYDIFPERNASKSLRDVIGKLPVLGTMSEISADDIYHAYREFDPRMLPWIESLREGQSAFENQDSARIPHRIVDGVMKVNASKNGDKYARCYWDKEGPCIHTRNDILASQNTIHPRDNRVFSIRELMLMMSVPVEFEWSSTPYCELNKLTKDQKYHYLKQSELNIRHCIGEAVPTAVFSSIAYKIKHYTISKHLSVSSANAIIKSNNLYNLDNLKKFIVDNYGNYHMQDIFLICELSNNNRIVNSAFYTRYDTAYSLVKNLPNIKKPQIRILEPAVGVGNFIPLLINKYYDIPEIIIDVVDIDESSLEILKTLLHLYQLPSNVTVNLINSDFLLMNTENHYDILIGNPPFGKVKNKGTLVKYKKLYQNKETNNIFAYFIEKSLGLADYVALIVPKSLLNAPEFYVTRELLVSNNVKFICDYGESAFKGVKIETIGIGIENKGLLIDNEIIVESYITKTRVKKLKDYIFSKNFPCWLIYRDELFDSVVSKLKLGVFNSVRDRQITKKHTHESGRFRVLKSRNIGVNEIINIDDYDTYIDDLSEISIAKYLNETKAILVPNLTYYPRATFMPPNSIVDGSVAILMPKDEALTVSDYDLRYLASDEFRAYYKVARNYGTRSLNIDSASVYFFGVRDDNRSN